jgi:hypothetical protein
LFLSRGAEFPAASAAGAASGSRDPESMDQNSSDSDKRPLSPTCGSLEKSSRTLI